MDEFKHLERHLPEELGLAADAIRQLRIAHLQKDADFILKKPAGIIYSAAGLEKLRSLLHLATAQKIAPKNAQDAPEPPTVPSPDPAEKTATAQTVRGAGVLLKVWKPRPDYPANERILEAYVEGTDPRQRANILRVQVRSNRKYVNGMVVAAVLVREPDLYAVVRRY